MDTAGDEILITENSPECPRCGCKIDGNFCLAGHDQRDIFLSKQTVEAKIKLLEIQRDDLTKQIHKLQTDLETMRYALKRHHCNDPDWHIRYRDQKEIEKEAH